MEAEIKGEGKKSGKVEFVFSVVDRIFKVGLLVLIGVGIIVYYTSSNGRYSSIPQEGGMSGGYYEVFDTRTGTHYKTQLWGGEVLISSFNAVTGKHHVQGKQWKTTMPPIEEPEERTAKRDYRVPSPAPALPAPAPAPSGQIK